MWPVFSRYDLMLPIISTDVKFNLLLGTSFCFPWQLLSLVHYMGLQTGFSILFFKLCRVVQLNFPPEIDIFYMLFERSLSNFSTTSLKQHEEYFNFRCKIQLDLPVVLYIMTKTQVLRNAIGNAICPKKTSEMSLAAFSPSLSYYLLVPISAAVPNLYQLRETRLLGSVFKRQQETRCWK